MPSKGKYDKEFPLPLATLVFEECCPTQLFSLGGLRMKILVGPEFLWLEKLTSPAEYCAFNI